MKKYKYFIIGLAFILSVSCRTVKSRSEATAMQSQTVHQQSAWAWNAYDSTGRYWFLQTDSPFFYHPGRGLLAYGGSLALAEAQVRRQSSSQTDSSSRHQQDEQSTHNYSAKPAPRSTLCYLLGAGGALLLLFWWAKRR